MSETTQHPQPPTTSPTGERDASAAAPRRLTRRSSDRLLGGVAGGIADYLGVDPVLVRLAFVALAFLNLLGVLAYLVAWVVVPADDATAAPLEQAVDAATPSAGGRRVVGIVLLVLGGLLVLGPLTQGSTLLSWWGGGQLTPGLVWAAVLITVGVLLYRMGDPAGPRTGGAPPQSPAARAAEVPPPPPTATTPTTTGAAMAAAGTATSPTTAPGADAPPPGSPPPPMAEDHDGAGGQAGPPQPERSALGRLTLAAALVAVGAAALLDAAGVLALGAVDLLAIALLVVGAGLLVGTVAGRARWLIAVGLVLLPVIAAVGVVETVAAREAPFLAADGARVGERVLAPDDLAELDDAYRLAAGSLVVDLSGIEEGPGDAALDLAVGAGEIEVVLPPELAVDIAASAGLGNVTLPSRDADGFDVDLDERWPGEAGAGELRLDARVGAGEITVSTPEPTQGGRR